MSINIFLLILMIAFITFLTRLLPFILFRNKKPPKIFEYFENYIPPVIMLLLVLYCLKDIKWINYPFGMPEIISIVIVFLLHLWKKNALLSIVTGTVIYILLIQYIFV